MYKNSLSDSTTLKRGIINHKLMKHRWSETVGWRLARHWNACLLSCEAFGWQTGFPDTAPGEKEYGAETPRRGSLQPWSVLLGGWTLLSHRRSRPQLLASCDSERSVASWRADAPCAPPEASLAHGKPGLSHPSPSSRGLARSRTLSPKYK